MQYEFKLPDIGEGVAEGEILKWMVKEGEKVSEDQSLVEVMTDKVNVQIPSPKKGVIAKLLVKEGDVVKVGQGVLVIDVEGPDGEAGSSQHPQQQQQQQQPAGMAEPSGRGSAQPSGIAPPAQTSNTADKVMATPATRRLARELGLDIAQIRGTGPVGRILDDDVRKANEKAAGSGPAEKPVASTAQTLVVPPPSPSTAPSSRLDEERIPVRGIRKAVGERMVKSVHAAPHVTHVEEVDVTELVLLREALKGSAEKRGVKLTYLPLIIKAIIPALKQSPYINASLDEKSGDIVLKKRYNIGIATDTEQGLVVPVVKDADKKDIFELSAEIGALAQRVRAGQLNLDEVHGSTFTITNLGAVGGLFATPIINYPEAAILGVYRITKRPVVRDGKIEIRDMMYLSLTFDHRVLDGAQAARFVNAVVDIIQDPKKLLAEIL